MEDLNNNAWINKYKPQSTNELLIPEDTDLVPVNHIIKKLLDKCECMYSGLVLYGDGGSGKTAFIDRLKVSQDWMIYTVPDTGAGKLEIDELESAIQLRLNTVFKQKVLVVANELSKSTKDFRDGLRGLIDRYNGSLFIAASDNNITKLREENPQLVGFRRLLEINWDLIGKQQVSKRCAQILAKENAFNPQNAELLKRLVDKYSPDIGTILQLLQSKVEAANE